jgi:hypothetical protein
MVLIHLTGAAPSIGDVFTNLKHNNQPFEGEFLTNFI